MRGWWASVGRSSPCCCAPRSSWWCSSRRCPRRSCGCSSTWTAAPGRVSERRVRAPVDAGTLLRHGASMTDSLAGPLPEGESGGGESTLTVLIAFAANIAIAVAKTVVALLTGSASMLAESAHSWADTGNEIFLLVADRKSRRPPDAAHPFGYGRESYVWSMFAAMGLFTAGAVVSVWNGVSKLFEEGEDTSYFWAYVVLGIAFVLEGISFLQAFKQTSREAKRYDREIVEHALATSDPTLRARAPRSPGRSA